MTQRFSKWTTGILIMALMVIGYLGGLPDARTDAAALPAVAQTAASKGVVTLNIGGSVVGQNLSQSAALERVKPFVIFHVRTPRVVPHGLTLQSVVAGLFPGYPKGTLLTLSYAGGKGAQAFALNETAMTLRSNGKPTAHVMIGSAHATVIEQRTGRTHSVEVLWMSGGVSFDLRTLQINSSLRSTDLLQIARSIPAH